MKANGSLGANADEERSDLVASSFARSAKVLNSYPRASSSRRMV